MSSYIKMIKRHLQTSISDEVDPHPGWVMISERHVSLREIHNQLLRNEAFDQDIAFLTFTEVQNGQYQGVEINILAGKRFGKVHPYTNSDYGMGHGGAAQ